MRAQYLENQAIDIRIRQLVTAKTNILIVEELEEEKLTER